MCHSSKTVSRRLCLVDKLHVYVIPIPFDLAFSDWPWDFLSLLRGGFFQARTLAENQRKHACANANRESVEIVHKQRQSLHTRRFWLGCVDGVADF